MTIPYQHNCQHSPDGWCLSCVRNLAAEKDQRESDADVMRGMVGVLSDACRRLVAHFDDSRHDHDPVERAQAAEEAREAVKFADENVFGPPDPHRILAVRDGQWLQHLRNALAYDYPEWNGRPPREIAALAIDRAKAEATTARDAKWSSEFPPGWVPHVPANVRECIAGHASNLLVTVRDADAPRFRLIQDDSSHWYVCPVELAEEAGVMLDDGHVPTYLRAVGRASGITFTNPRDNTAPAPQPSTGGAPAEVPTPDSVGVGMVEIIGPSGTVHYRRPANHPDVEEARRTPGYSVQAYLYTHTGDNP
jgi:hypothetical protein